MRLPEVGAASVFYAERICRGDPYVPRLRRLPGR